MNLAKELKKKRDSEKRLEQNSPTTIFVEDGSNGEKSYNDYSNFATKKQLNDGLEEKADTEHSHNFIELEDTPLSYVGQAGKVAKVNATEDGLEFVEGGSEGGSDAESILTKPISIASFIGKDGYILAYDETNNQFYLKVDEGGGGDDRFLELIDFDDPVKSQIII